MISPHLLNIAVSHSISFNYYDSAEAMARDLWGDKTPIFIIEKTKNAKSKWCHMVLAKGPPLSDQAKESELIVIWFSEMGPDTERVLSIVDWEKHAADI